MIPSAKTAIPWGIWKSGDLGAHHIEIKAYFLQINPIIPPLLKSGIEISLREELLCQRCIVANLYQSKVTISCDASYSIGQVSFGESANRISNITLLCSLNNPFLLILMV